MDNLKGYILALSLLITLGFILLSVGTATNNWIEHNDQPITVGLFQYCLQDRCLDIDLTSINDYDLEHTLGAIRAFCILGVISSGLAFFCFVLIMFKIYMQIRCIPDKQRLGTCCAILCFCAGGCTMIGVIVFDAKWYKEYYSSADTVSKGPSFLCCVVGLVLILVGGIIALITVMQFTPESRPPVSTQGQVFFLPSTGCQNQIQTQHQQQQHHHPQSQQGQMQGQHPQRAEESLWQRQERNSPCLDGQTNQNNHMQQSFAVRPPSYRSSAPSYRSSQPANPSALSSQFGAATSPPQPPSSYQSPPPSYESVTKQFGGRTPCNEPPPYKP